MSAANNAPITPTPTDLLSFALTEFFPNEHWRVSATKAIMGRDSLPEAIYEFDTWAKLNAKLAVVESMPDRKLPESREEQRLLRDRHLGKIEDHKKILAQLLPRYCPEKFYRASCSAKRCLEPDTQDEETLQPPKKMNKSALPVPDAVPSKTLDEPSAVEDNRHSCPVCSAADPRVAALFYCRVSEARAAAAAAAATLVAPSTPKKPAAESRLPLHEEGSWIVLEGSDVEEDDDGDVDPRE